MFVKISKANGYSYVSIVESSRDENGVSRHSVLYNLGRYDLLKADPGFIKCVKKLCHMLEIPLLEDRQKVRYEDCSEAEMLNYGYLAYARLWEQLGIRECLAKLGRGNRETALNLEKTTMLMAIQHLLCPRSKLSTYEHQDVYWGLPNIPLAHLYRSLDRLAKSKEIIEQVLFEHNNLKLGQEVDVVFYDVTTFAFQSVQTDEVRNFGFSKDCKFHETQVVMGLLLDSEGMPMGYELFPGNTFDGKTMVTSLANLKRKYSIRKVVIVADRGLNSKMNLNLIKEAGYGYIMASRLRSMGSSIQKAALDQTGYVAVAEDFKYKTLPYVNVFKDEDKNVYSLEENLVISWSQKRAVKDVRDRQRLVEKAEKLLKNPASIKALSKRGGKKYLTDNSGKTASWTMDEAKIEQDAILDGYYGIQTSEKEMAPTDVMNAYRMLWKIEDSFRVMKSTMEVRPIFHWTPSRIKGHFVMCYLAFMMERKLEALLATPDSVDDPVSPERIRAALNSMQLARLETNGEIIFIKTKNLPLGSKIFKSLRLNLPMNVSRTQQLIDQLTDKPIHYDAQLTMF